MSSESMWLARPLYEALPYVYALGGTACLVASWFASGESWSLALLLVGALSLLAGLVIWLKRRDFRAQQAEYDRHSLDD